MPSDLSEMSDVDYPYEAKAIDDWIGAIEQIIASPAADIQAEIERNQRLLQCTSTLVVIAESWQMDSTPLMEFERCLPPSTDQQLDSRILKDTFLFIERMQYRVIGLSKSLRKPQESTAIEEQTTRTRKEKGEPEKLVTDYLSKNIYSAGCDADVLAAAEKMTLAQIAEDTGLAKSTVHSTEAYHKLKRIKDVMSPNLQPKKVASFEDRLGKGVEGEMEVLVKEQEAEASSDYEHGV